MGEVVGAGFLVADGGGTVRLRWPGARSERPCVTPGTVVGTAAGDGDTEGAGAGAEDVGAGALGAGIGAGTAGDGIRGDVGEGCRGPGTGAALGTALGTAGAGGGATRFAGRTGSPRPVDVVPLGHGRSAPGVAPPTMPTPRTRR